ncbi:flavodoxin FldA [Pleurocapsa sp. PCC 7319]|uniref:flavodoxin FldA n=1 Tax=Pleurocapsa sp. PCC 7319 TaxID=118161 RepID=UPI00034BFA42|nr:flavodoxin FldA [Pleurocapsa sp. PCC 7319]
MAKVGLFYGSTTGKTEAAAEEIQSALGGEDVVTLHEIADVSEEFADYDCLIIGCPTWDVGELQSDWEGFYDDELDSVNFSGKKVAYFGTGDQVGYADNFQDAMGILEEKISSLGGTTVGHWSTDGYEHEASRAEKNGKFVGLALDEDNQSELTEGRIQEWTTQLKSEFGL